MGGGMVEVERVEIQVRKATAYLCFWKFTRTDALQSAYIFGRYRLQQVGNAYNRPSHISVSRPGSFYSFSSAWLNDDLLREITDSIVGAEVM
jgi:hypothetical protein